MARDLSEVAGHLQPRQLTPFLTAALLSGWKQRLAPATAFTRRNVLKRLLRMLDDYGAPKLAPQLPRLRKPEPRGVTAAPEQITRILAAAPPFLRLFVLLCWQTALRHREAMSAAPSNYDAERHLLTVPVKGAKHRTIPTTPEIETLFAAAVIDPGEQQTPYVWLLRRKKAKNGTWHGSDKGISDAWNRLTAKLGIRGLHPHDLRRTTATNLYRLSKDLRAVQQYLGHRLSRRHHALPRAALRGAAARVPPPPQLP